MGWDFETRPESTWVPRLEGALLTPHLQKRKLRSTRGQMVEPGWNGIPLTTGLFVAPEQGYLR